MVNNNQKTLELRKQGWIRMILMTRFWEARKKKQINDLLFAVMMLSGTGCISEIGLGFRVLAPVLFIV